MKNRIIVDSCCDMTPELKKEFGVVSVPLTMMLENQEFQDDDSLDINDFMNQVKKFAGKVGSASPSPFLYEEALREADDPYIVTLSSKLSGSYNNALIANRTTMNGVAPAYVFDSKSASAGQTLIVIKLHELLKEGVPRESLIKKMHQFIEKMKTFFVLENYDNLKKNGRLSKVTGALIQVLNIKLVMGANGNGEISLFEKCRGTKQVIEHLTTLIRDKGKETMHENLVISHNNNESMVGQLLNSIRVEFNFKKIYVVPTGGISSLYADDKGIILAF